MSGSDMPRFEKDWYFLGFVDRYDYKEFIELLAKYKCTMRGGPRKSVFVNNPFRIDSIRKRLWGHRWATHKDWMSENPSLADFDPRAKVKSGPRAGQ